MKDRTAVREAAYLLMLSAAAAALLLFPEVSSEAVVRGLLLCGRVILPSLFPFFVCSELLTELSLAQLPARLFSGLMQPLFHIRGEGAAALVLGFLGGYPSGAQITARLYESGAVSKNEAERLLLFCNNAGPAFIVGVAGAGVFGSAAAGFLLWGVHIFCALLCGVLLRGPKLPMVRRKGENRSSGGASFAQAFTASVRNAGASALQVCMFVVIFSVCSAFFQSLLPDGTPAPLRVLLVGMLELSNGMAAMQSAGASLPLAAFLLGFSGLGVWAQTQSLLAESGLDLRRYLPAKLLHGLLSALLTWALARLPAVRDAALPAFSSAGGANTLPLLLPLWGIAGSICLRFRKLMSSNPVQKRV